MRRVVGLDTSVSLIFYAMMIGSIYLLFAGHNQPGGGFVGGLVAGAAIALRYVAGGIDEVRRISPFMPWTILGTGVVLSTSVALVPILLGDAVLDNALVEGDVPLLGHVKATSGAVFDLGVYLVVIGVVLMVVEAFGERFDPADDAGERVL
jgi:multisubunit Na+/H+ antiporter MnhB subunit